VSPFLNLLGSCGCRLPSLRRMTVECKFDSKIVQPRRAPINSNRTRGSEYTFDEWFDGHKNASIGSVLSTPLVVSRRVSLPLMAEMRELSHAKTRFCVRYSLEASGSGTDPSLV
jgi:hypothetical protein